MLPPLSGFSRNLQSLRKAYLSLPCTSFTPVLVEETRFLAKSAGRGPFGLWWSAARKLWAPRRRWGLIGLSKDGENLHGRGGGRKTSWGWLGASSPHPLVWGQCPEGHRGSASLGWDLEESPCLLETDWVIWRGRLVQYFAPHGCPAYSSGREFGGLNSSIKDNDNNR